MAVEASGSGRLKVIIVQGKNLVIRDFRSSDPYVIVKLGKQVSPILNLKCSSKFHFPLTIAIDYCIIQLTIVCLFLIHTESKDQSDKK